MGSYGPHLFPSGGGANEEGLPGAPLDSQKFPGVNGSAMGRPPRMNKPHARTLVDGTEVKWCSACGKWVDHFRGGHTTVHEVLEGANRVEEGAGVEVSLETEVLTKPGKEREVEKELEDNVKVDDTGGKFARLRRAGLI